MTKVTTPTGLEDEEDVERYYLPSDSKCPAPEVHLLGLVVIWFGNLEFFLEMSIWQLLTPEDNKERYLFTGPETSAGVRMTVAEDSGGSWPDPKSS